ALAGSRAGTALCDVGPLLLKGLLEPVAVCEVTWEPRPSPTGPRDLRVRVLGAFTVEGVALRAFGTRRARTLLKVLALGRGRPVSVDRLVECLWPDGRPARPSVQVSVLVSRLRSVLGPDRLPHTPAGYALVADWIDAQALDELAEVA